MIDFKKINESVTDALHDLTSEELRQADEVCAMLNGIEQYLGKTHFMVNIFPLENCALGYNFKSKKIIFSNLEVKNKNLLECSSAIRLASAPFLSALLEKLKEFKC